MPFPVLDACMYDFCTKIVGVYSSFCYVYISSAPCVFSCTMSKSDTNWFSFVFEVTDTAEVSTVNTNKVRISAQDVKTSGVWTPYWY